MTDFGRECMEVESNTGSALFPESLFESVSTPGHLGALERERVCLCVCRQLWRSRVEATQTPLHEEPGSEVEEDGDHT